jgi:acyl-CoA thioesterase-2
MTSESSQPHLDTLLRLLDLEELDRDFFVGDPGPGEGRLFGGMVAAQSVAAAYRTVEEGQSMHSLHAYFLRGGRHGVPIRFVVSRVRDGRTFVTRDVVAYQAGEAIFDVSCSFTKPEPGMDHQEPMPEAPGPEGLKPWDWGHEVAGDIPEEMRREMTRWRDRNPLEMLSCDPPGQAPEGETPRRRVWVRLKGTLPENELYHAAMIAYASDSGLLGTARHPRRRHMGPPRREHMGASASLDHSLWFHHPPRFDDWLLFTSESPVAHAARALIYGAMHRRDGTRILSVVQEGLVRLPRE